MWFSENKSSDSEILLGMRPPGFNELFRHMVEQAARAENTFADSKFVPMCLSKPVIPLRNNKNNNIPELNSFDVLQKLVSAIKLDSQQNTFISILKNIMAEELQQRDILDLILNILNIFQEDCPNKLDLLQEQLLELLLPKDLLAITIDKSSVKPLLQIASGAFGVITTGQLKLGNENVLDIIIKSSLPLKTKYLKSEAVIMNRLCHKNIVKILAFVENPMMIIMEKFDKGDLMHYLQDNLVSTINIYKMLMDILEGMEYLSENLYIHRDLATRNIFVNSKLECKIGDFGLCCQIKEPNGVYKQQDHRLEMYNTAPEARSTQEFSIKTDVFAIGLVMWEFFYLKDYNERSYHNLPIQEHLRRFYFSMQLPITKSCPEELTEYITDNILNWNPEERPTFTDIKRFISNNYANFVGYKNSPTLQNPAPKYKHMPPHMHNSF